MGNKKLLKGIMPKGFMLKLLAAVGIIAITSFADVVIDATNFPDENFRNWLTNSGNIDGSGADGNLTNAEIAAVTSISVAGKGISDLTGIEYFTALTTLYCNDNQLTELNVSSPALTELLCYNNQLTTLDVSNNPALTTLRCSDNQLTTLDVSNSPVLTRLDCRSNYMSGEDKIIGLDKTVTTTFSFSPQKTNIVSVELEYNTTVYNGSAQEPKLSGLTEGTDYEVISYSENTNTGTASVTVKGMGTYFGTDTKSFTITAKPLANEMLTPIPNQIHTGAAIIPEITVKDGETELVKDTDYSVAYSSNTAVGTATVTVTGAGNYSGTATASFEIVNDPTTAIGGNNRKSADKMLFKSTIVSDKMELFVNAECEMRNAELRIYDALGNVVYSANSQNGKFVWNLTNTAGRIVANGSYLVVVEATDKNGVKYRWSEKVGVKR